jgi:hypothetical protein
MGLPMKRLVPVKYPLGLIRLTETTPSILMLAGWQLDSFGGPSQVQKRGARASALRCWRRPASACEWGIYVVAAHPNVWWRVGNVPSACWWMLTETRGLSPHMYLRRCSRKCKNIAFAHAPLPCVSSFIIRQELQPPAKATVTWLSEWPLKVVVACAE